MSFQQTWQELGFIVFLTKVAEWKFDQLDTDRDGVLKKKELKVISKN